MLFFPYSNIFLGLFNNSIHFGIYQDSSLNPAWIKSIFLKSGIFFKFFKAFSINLRTLYSSISRWVSLAFRLRLMPIFLYQSSFLNLQFCCPSNCRFTANCQLWKSLCLLAIWVVISAKRFIACVSCNSLSFISPICFSTVFMECCGKTDRSNKWERIRKLKSLVIFSSRALTRLYHYIFLAARM